MKRFNLTLILLLFSTMAHSSSDVPDVTIEYSPFRDSICALFKSHEINDVWKVELEKKKVELEADWKEIGSTLLSATETIVGKEFNRASDSV